MNAKWCITVFALLLTFGWSNLLLAQVDLKNEVAYNFIIDKKIDCTTVKSQDNTGTCWSFATASFLESELLRKGKGSHDLSEMYVVRNIYRDKARNYVLRQGKANFSQGSLSHDLINVVQRHGMVPESVYSGKLEGETRHDHSEMATVLKGMLDGVLKRKRLSAKWPLAFDKILDVYLGEAPKQFTYQGRDYTPKSFVESMDIKSKDYVNISSYVHHPFYEQFILEIPDNYSNGSFYNVPIDELMAIMEYAIGKGYSVAWDGDVSEKGFSAKNGIAILPKDPKREDLFVEPGEEVKVSQEMRQETFESYSTTDDHLMHLTGTAKDKNGTRYFLIKNSWGEISDYKGFLYMSEAYAKLKTVSIMVHKDAIPADIAKKMLQ
ncbi:MAG: C1 family peptidase [Bacteroidota bacterium]